MSHTEDRCLECGQVLEEKTYALYRQQTPKGKHTKGTDKDDAIIGFLCRMCSKKRKVKPIKSRNELHKLKELF
ncbi:hypothetical protein [Caldalkalibacillus salinus]|uniref:hypothetical protein n=1 Tax=Caldalkalibacillus salinus TaxID=2803787 RepID=UPI001923F782|nr:hypothetical protein [Caldalkalibacillus salinus]